MASSTDPRDSRKGPTSAQLRHDIDRGATGDKTPGVDPAAAPLGTDEEAGGAAPTPAEIAHARNAERRDVKRGANAAAPELTPDGARARGASSFGVALAWIAALALLAVLIWYLAS
jgi:hypothetical protein